MPARKCITFESDCRIKLITFSHSTYFINSQNINSEKETYKIPESYIKNILKTPLK